MTAYVLLAVASFLYSVKRVRAHHSRIDLVNRTEEEDY